MGPWEPRSHIPAQTGLQLLLRKHPWETMLGVVRQTDGGRPPAREGRAAGEAVLWAGAPVAPCLAACTPPEEKHASLGVHPEHLPIRWPSEFVGKGQTSPWKAGSQEEPDWKPSAAAGPSTLPPGTVVLEAPC